MTPADTIVQALLAEEGFDAFDAKEDLLYGAYPSPEAVSTRIMRELGGGWSAKPGSETSTFGNQWMEDGLKRYAIIYLSVKKLPVSTNGVRVQTEINRHEHHQTGQAVKFALTSLGLYVVHISAEPARPDNLQFVVHVVPRAYRQLANPKSLQNRLWYYSISHPEFGGKHAENYKVWDRR